MQVTETLVSYLTSGGRLMVIVLIALGIAVSTGVRLRLDGLHLELRLEGVAVEREVRSPPALPSDEQAGLPAVSSPAAEP